MTYTSLPHLLLNKPQHICSWQGFLEVLQINLYLFKVLIFKDSGPAGTHRAGFRLCRTIEYAKEKQPLMQAPP
jgi:hypothetical protein